MGEVLRKWLKQSVPMEPGLDAMLNLLVAAKVVENELEQLLQEFGITRRQYNVLRILKGVYPNGHPRSEIAARVIEQSPDITRILDRLEQQNFITRSKGQTDKRENLTFITPEGIALSDSIAPLVAEFTKKIEAILTTEGSVQLSEFCERLYAEKA